MHLLLKWSIAALLAGNSMDAVSSWGQPELNPVLGSQFGMRSTAIKFGIVGAAMGTEAMLAKRHPKLAKPFAIANFAEAGMFGAVAVRNWRVR